MNTTQKKSVKVIKIGGGCLRHPEDLLRVSKIIESEDNHLAVVVSAINGATNLLINGIDAAIDSENNIPAVIKSIRDKHRQIIENTLGNNEIKNQIDTALESKIEKLERLLYGIAYTEEIIDPIKALIVSYGERLSAIIVAGVLNDQGILAEPMESDTIGIVTDPSYENATVILAATKKNLQKTLTPVINKGCVPIITGYFGCSENGKITTFGRNGTDYSAAVVARSLDAQTLLILKDVDGFMSADPKFVKNAKPISQLSYYEAAELSYFGAKILHPRTVEPLMDAGIEILIRNFHNTNNHGTVVSLTSHEKHNILKSVTYNDAIAVLRILGSGVGHKPGIIGEIGRMLSEIGINIYSVLTSQTCINLFVNANDAQKSHQNLQQLTGGVIERIDVINDIALIAVVGEGVIRTKGLAAKVFSAVAKEEVNVEMISAGASEVAYYFIVAKKDLNKAVNAIHTNFFEKDDG